MGRKSISPYLDIKNEDMYIINPYSGASFDTDAQAYLNACLIPNDGTIYYNGTAQQITGAEIWTAVNAYYVGAKADGFYTKDKAFYLFIGGTASAHKFNGKDPRDLDVANRLVFNGTITHNSLGFVPNGSTGYANTFLNPYTDLAQNSIHVSSYCNTTQSALGSLLGLAPTTALNYSIILYPYFSGQAYLNLNSSGGNNHVTSASSKAYHLMSRTGSTNFAYFQNSTKTILNLNSVPVYNGYIFLGCNNIGGTPTNFSLHAQSFVSIGDGYTDTDAANKYTRVQALQTALHRQV